MRWVLPLLLLLTGCFDSHDTGVSGGGAAGTAQEELVPLLPPHTEFAQRFEWQDGSWVSPRRGPGRGPCGELVEGFADFDGCTGSGWGDGVPAKIIVSVESCWHGDEFSLSAFQESGSHVFDDLATETWDADGVLSGEMVTLEFAATDGTQYRYEYWIEHGLLCHGLPR